MPLTTDAIDAALERLESLLTEVEKCGDTFFTEADTRIKIIDTMLMDVLGWQKADKNDLVAYMCGLGFERRVVALWLDALLKRALLFNYDPTCVDEQNATQLELSPTGELHLFWGCGGYDYLFAMAETTPIRDEATFTEMELA